MFHCPGFVLVFEPGGEHVSKRRRQTVSIVMRTYPRFGRSGSVSTGSYRLAPSGLGPAVAARVKCELRLEGDDESVLRSVVNLEHWLLRDTVDMLVAEDKVATWNFIIGHGMRPNSTKPLESVVCDTEREHDVYTAMTVTQADDERRRGPGSIIISL